MPKTLLLETAMLPDGWARDLRIEIDDSGRITALQPGGNSDGAERVPGLSLPGMANLHCHSFQRAMAGLAERAGPEGDDFWGWREIMYRFLDRLSPEAVEAIASQLYIEMLKAGYTGVAEFHYLHNDPLGAPYADPAEIAWRIVAAAELSGIRLTLLPALYQTGNFGGAAPSPGQRRFVTTTAGFLDIVDRLDRARRTGSAFSLGMAPHSLRAVPKESLAEALAALDLIDPTAPIHIHVAEQEREVRDCVAWCGRRPVEWLLGEMPVDGRWVAIHATHMLPDEVTGLACSGAVAGLCPTTEGNLADGFFPLADYLASGGRFGIGSDSNVTVDPLEELRWLHYGQRLTTGRRGLGQSEGGASPGPALWRSAALGGARALGQPAGALAPGRFADLVVVDDHHPALAGRIGDAALDSLIFGPAHGAIRHAMVGGSWVLRDGRHAAEEEAAERYRRAIADLIAS